MSKEWLHNPEEVVRRESPPRILNDIQAVTGRLYHDFSDSGEPITDDNPVLHKLCVKLEYLLQMCMKEKTLLGSDRHYWHWMYDCLKRSKGLSDGLKFVRANKEFRTAQGRGRALVRYSLVHQTLADSFQNCLMNRAKSLDYLKPMCILMRSSQSTIFLNALYELNDVNFDLLSKGYDLDSAWPTFASKRNGAAPDQWRLPSDRAGSFGSLGSYVSHMTSVSMLPDNRRNRGMHSLVGFDADYRGTVSSGPPSVDHRVEELVLELGESDLKIQELEETLKQTEAAANNAAECASQKQEILANLVTDYESKSQIVISQMTTEFENRDQLRDLECQDLRTKLKETEEIASKLKNRVSILEEDKRNLEDIVSARMTMITRGFAGTNSDSMPYTDVDERHLLSQKLEKSERERLELVNNVRSLRAELMAVSERMEAEKKELSSSFSAQLESLEDEWKQKIDRSLASATDNVINRLSIAMRDDNSSIGNVSAEEKLEFFENKIVELLNEVSELRRTSSKLHRETMVQKSREEEIESETTEIIEKLEIIRQERDNSIIEMTTMRDQLVNVTKEMQNLKLKHEAELSNHKKNMVDLKESHFRLQENAGKTELTNKALRDDNQLLQQKYKQTAADLRSLRLRCADLKEQCDERMRQWESAELEEKLQYIKDLENAKSQLERQHVEDLTQFEACMQENETLKEQVKQLNSEIQNHSSSTDKLKTEIAELTCCVSTLEEEKSTLSDELAMEKSNGIEETQKNIQLSAAITDLIGSFKSTEKQYQTLTENLAKREVQSTDTQMNAIKACIETERTLAKKEYDELSGENESRKRMVASLERKLNDLREENSSLTKKLLEFGQVGTSLEKALEEKEEFEKSFYETEQELITAAEKLESERVLTIELRKEITNGIDREENMKKEMEENESICNELKAKLIQLVHEKDALWKELDELKYFQKLQEDGEETDARWMEDQEARYCLHCGVEFSIIVRKHHCRVCGKIFCSKCSKQWIKSNDGKLERCCLGCLERHRNSNEIKTLTSGISSPKESPAKSNSAKGNNVSLRDDGFDTITDEELYESKAEMPVSTSVADDSLYITAGSHFSEHSSDSISSLPYDENDDKWSKEVTISAGDTLQLPITIDEPGTTISWKFSTDRSIDFQVTYYNDEVAENRQTLKEKQRCDSHVNPIEGQLVANYSGSYVLEFDNKFSRFTSKSLKY